MDRSSASHVPPITESLGSDAQNINHFSLKSTFPDESGVTGACKEDASDSNFEPARRYVVTIHLSSPPPKKKNLT